MCSKANAQQAPVNWPISRDIGKTKLSQTEPFFQKDAKKRQTQKETKIEWCGGGGEEGESRV